MRAFPTEQAIRARLLAKDAEPWSNGLFYETKKIETPATRSDVVEGNSNPRHPAVPLVITAGDENNCFS